MHLTLLRLNFSSLIKQFDGCRQPVAAQRQLPVFSMCLLKILSTCGLSAQYAGRSGGREHGFELRRLGGGWRIYSAPRWSRLFPVYC